MNNQEQSLIPLTIREHLTAFIALAIADDVTNIYQHNIYWMLADAVRSIKLTDAIINELAELERYPSVDPKLWTFCICGEAYKKQFNPYVRFHCEGCKGSHIGFTSILEKINELISAKVQQERSIKNQWNTAIRLIHPAQLELITLEVLNKIYG